MLQFRNIPPRLEAEPVRDYLIYAYWCSHATDTHAVAASLGLSPLLLTHLAASWNWHQRRTTTNDAPINPAGTPATTHEPDSAGLTARTTTTDGRIRGSENGLFRPSGEEPAAHTPELDRCSPLELSATEITTSNRHAYLTWLIDHWPLAWMSDLTRLAPGSRPGYLDDAARWLAWCESDGNDPLAASRGDVARYRDEMILGSAMPTRRRASAPTVSRRIAVVRQLYDWLMTAGLVPSNPARPLPLPAVAPHADAVRRAWLTPSERRAAVDTVDSWCSGRRDVRRLRDRALVYVLAYGAPRVAELCGLTVGALRDDELTWIGKSGRTRTIRLVPAVVDVLGEYLEFRRRSQTGRLAASAPMFATKSGRGLTTRQARKIVDRVCRGAGIAHRSPHAWRHGLITSARQAGLSRDVVQAYIGHVSGETTARYEHVAPGRDRDAGAVLWDLDQQRDQQRDQRGPLDERLQA